MGIIDKLPTILHRGSQLALWRRKGRGWVKDVELYPNHYQNRQAQICLTKKAFSQECRNETDRIRILGVTNTPIAESDQTNTTHLQVAMQQPVQISRLLNLAR